ncbi:MAG: hypothetical protein IMY87_03840 [Chloroflexi bacterium]|jgi:hypothetical protein|nr:hypothetical protein [Chloroflexota bacterium]
METIGLTRNELLNLIDKKITEKESQQPPHTPEVYDWVEKTISHHIAVVLEALLEVLDENNKRIAQQLKEML